MSIGRGAPFGVPREAALWQDTLRRIAALERASSSGSSGGDECCPIVSDTEPVDPEEGVIWVDPTADCGPGGGGGGVAVAAVGQTQSLVTLTMLTWVELDWTDAVHDQGGIDFTDPKAPEVPEDGLYLVTYGLSTGGIPQNEGLRLRLISPSSSSVGNYSYLNASGGFRVSVSTVLSLAAGDAVSAEAYYQGTTSPDASQCDWSIVKLGENS